MNLFNGLTAFAMLLCMGVQAQDDNSKKQDGTDQGEVMQQLLDQMGVKVDRDDTPYQPLGMTGSFSMEVNSYNDGVPEKNSPMTIHYYFDDAHMAMVMEVPTAKQQMHRLIYDLKGKSYVMLMENEGKKTGIKMPMMTIDFDEQDKVPDSDKMNIERTGKTKVIDGRTCHQYVGEDESGTWDAWIDEGTEMNMNKVLSNMTQGKKAESWQRSPFNNGLMLESLYKKKDSKETIHMFTKNIKVGTVDKSVFSTAGYQVQDLSNLPGMGSFGQ